MREGGRQALKEKKPTTAHIHTRAQLQLSLHKYFKNKCSIGSVSMCNMDCAGTGGELLQKKG
jgi:hypothetical protein